MNKRITSILLSLVMIMGMFVFAVPAYAIGKGEFTVTPDKTTVAPGDEITYTVSIGPIEHLQSINFTFVIPEGLNYGVGKEVDGLKELLGSDKAEYTDSTKTFVVSGGGDYSSTGETVLMKFTCTVAADAAPGEYKIELEGDEYFGDTEYNDLPVTINMDASKVTVTAPSKPATGITLDKTSLALTVGDVETLVATVTPADTTDKVTWASGDDSVATVDAAGKVTAVGVGETTITAKAGSVSATCAVKVESAPCTHANKTTVPEKASNCTNRGWDAYQICDDCGALFDSTGNPIAEIPYRALNDDHDFDTTTWGYKGADGHAHVCTRNPDHHDAVVPHTSSGPATEDTAETCTVCGYVITPATGHVCASHLTKVEAEAATCTDPGNLEHYKCSCGKLYADGTASVELSEEDVVIDALGHDWAEEWSSDATNHWHACTRCTAKKDEGAHNPGAPATETTPQTCIDCGYVIAPATGHVCASHLTKVEAKPATCTDEGVVEHYKCSCGKLYWDDDAFDEITDTDELVIDALGHDWAEEWSSDETNHWHACTRCDATTDLHAHNPDHEGGATVDYPILCTDCGYVMEEQLVEGTIRVELPFRLTVQQLDEMAPGAQTFRFLVFGFGAPVDYEIITDTVDTDGAKTYQGTFTFTIPEQQWDNLSEGFSFLQVVGDAEGWTYDPVVYYAMPEFRGNDGGVSAWTFYEVTPDGWPDYDSPVEEMVFVNGYAAKKPVEPTPSPKPSEPPKPSEAPKPTQTLKPVQPPQTGDHSQLMLWATLLVVSGAVGMALVSQKRRRNQK